MANSITVSIATLFSRKEILSEMLHKIIDYVDRINIYAHNYLPENLPDILKHEKINITYDLEYGDNGDLDKFHWVTEIKEGYHFILDDDFLLPEDFFEKAIEFMKDNPSVVGSFHGSDIIKPPIANYYNDRVVYHYKSKLEENLFDVGIIGTGLMFYNAETINIDNIKDYIKDKPSNMSDILFSVYAHINNIRLAVVKHDENWIIDNPKLDLSETIYGQNYKNPYNMTKFINENKDVFEYYIDHQDYEPLISVAVLISRAKTKPEYVQQCLDSIRNQTYKNIETIIVYNDDKLISIGKGYNTLAKKANGEYVLYVNDDDYIAPDYVASLVAAVKQNIDNPKIYHISSFLTLFRRSGENLFVEQKQLVPIGMFKKEILLQEGFKEYLLRYVDSEYMDRMKSKGYEEVIVQHNYGYFYRSHEQQISGFKTFSNENGNAVNKEKFYEYLTTVEV